MLFQPRKLTMPFGWFPQLLSISGHRIDEAQAISSRSLCKGCNFTKFRGLLNGICRKQYGCAFFPRCFEVCCVLFYKQRCRASHAKIWKQQEILEHCTQYRSPQDFNILQHTSTIFNPKLNLKTHPVGAAQSFKIVGERHPNNRQESATTTAYYCI